MAPPPTLLPALHPQRLPLHPQVAAAASTVAAYGAKLQPASYILPSYLGAYYFGNMNYLNIDPTTLKDHIKKQM